jgi:hypothetical protein
VSDDSSFFSVYFDPPSLHHWLPNSVACILVSPEDRTLAGDGVDSIENTTNPFVINTILVQDVSRDVLISCYNL